MKNKLTLFQTLAPYGIAVTIKEQDLHLRGPSVYKHVEVTIEWIVVQLVFHQCTQAIVGLAHISRCRTQPHTNVAFGKEH